MSQTEYSLAEARRIALAAQGFGRPRPRGRIKAGHFHDAMGHLALLQLDYVNVLIPAHNLILFSRLGAYDLGDLNDTLYGSGQYTEQWAHEACIVPVETLPLLRHMMDFFRQRARILRILAAEHGDYVEQVLGQVRAKGPLSAADIALPEDITPEIPAKHHKVIPKFVLLGHFGDGRLAVVKRLDNFQRVYDLAERVIAKSHLERHPDADVARREILLISARAHGIGTIADLADYFRLRVPVARPIIRDLAAEGLLREVTVEGWKEPAYLHPGAEAPPKKITAARLLSPFDPLVWFRPRSERLFDFEYRIEIYLPKAKRAWGYYVLPFLMDERIAARVDLKAERQSGQLRVLASYLEPGTAADKVAAALAGELRILARWLGLETVHVAKKGNLARALAKAVVTFTGVLRKD